MNHIAADNAQKNECNPVVNGCYVGLELNTEKIAKEAESLNLDYEVATTVEEALAKAEQQLSESDMLFIGGSTFVVAEVLERL